MHFLAAPAMTEPGTNDAVVKLPLPPALDLILIPGCPKMPCKMEKREKEETFRGEE